MKSIFITGTAGAGKSLLTSKINEYYAKNDEFCAILNLDPGVEELPYACDVDVRDHIDIVSIMRQYGLGPNGALVMASDLIAAKIDDIKTQVERVNPDYLLVDTPGQVELFAHRSSGPFLVQNLTCEEKMAVFVFDGTLVDSPVNFASVSLLAASIRLRLGVPAVNVLTKTDLVADKLAEILRWSTDPQYMEDAISREADGDVFSLTASIMRGLDFGDHAGGLIPVSSATGDGMAGLQGTLSRIMNLGEET